MSIKEKIELVNLKKIAKIVVEALKEMKKHARPGVSTKDLDKIGENYLKSRGARSAPMLEYNFPGWTCISVNNEVAHGIPRKNKILNKGDLVNIDVSAELDGYFADTGHSFQIPPFDPETLKLCNSAYNVMKTTISLLQPGMTLGEVGGIIQSESKKYGYKTIHNLASHGIGRSLHEYPHDIPNYYNPEDTRKLEEGMVITIEPFLTKGRQFVVESPDGWTLQTKDGSFAAQHENTVMITNKGAIFLTDL
ncbi:MAG: type I methionyl aminopeptidase [Leptospiraceae bacterium]|nr:type I methionyl aminopeptidase [Leptospiraceae bacterium]